VLRDLQTKRDEIDKAIKMIESVRRLSLGSTPAAAISPLKGVEAPGGEIEPSAFFGLTIYEATKKLLRIKRRQLTNPEIADGLAKGGLTLNSDDPANTIGSVLKRYADTEGDIVRLSPGRGGKWGLTEWTPHLRKRQTKENGDEVTPEDPKKMP
jgi:hypothetical protein